MTRTARRAAPALVLLLVALITVAAAVPAVAGLDPRLAPLAPYVGHVFSAQMSAPGAATPAVDVQQWEEILGGKAVRITHSINGGDYGGESIITWDTARQVISYWYITTDDFYTQGTITAGGDSLVTHEQVVGNAGNISEVKGVWRRTADGLTVTSRMLAGGQWLPKRTTQYRETPGAVPAFR